MISTNFIIGTGFIKCIPITFSGLEVAAAILVIEIEDVLVARIQSSGAAASICSKILILDQHFLLQLLQLNLHLKQQSPNP